MHALSVFYAINARQPYYFVRRRSIFSKFFVKAHSKQLKKEASVLSQGAANRDKIRGNFFLNRTVPLWNDLPVKVKEAKSLNGFKAGLDGLGLFSTGN